ncbi:MAG TPA: aldehyde dehydrogenase family protein [Steroidobacteraceae bacterium]|nr:aldehyde dehydrogenase family protein [Steroidobacteraceae bacterium]
MTSTGGNAIGERPSANGPQPAPDLEVTSPTDGSVIASLPDQGAADVRAAVGRLRGNQPAWEALGPRGRGEWVGRLGDWLFDNDERIAELLQRETGKPWQEAALEIPTAIDLIEYYRKRAEKFLAESHPRPHGLLTASKRLTIAYRPYPVVGVICPWNFPILIFLADAVPALLAGATVAVKPSELTPLATREIVRGWREDLGAPAVLDCLTGAAATGAALVDEADFIQFTGSTDTGRKIAQRAAERLIPYSLELGGKDAMIVLADADLERAANGAAWGAMFNCGQACTSVERVYVEEPVHDEFVTLVADRVRGLRQGAGRQAFDTDVGPLSGEAQLATVERHVAEALAAGARAILGGKRADLPGATFEPTLLVDVDQSMSCMREETFGPTLPVMKVRDAEEAIRLANDSSYGLSASIWTRDRARGDRLARRLEVGAVNVNDMFTNVVAFPVPQAGWKQSGVGARLGGAHGVRKYCRPQAIVAARLTPKSELPWYPYDARTGKLALRLTRLLLARSWGRRLARRRR